MAELKISGRMSVKKLKENFKNEFGGTLRVYDGREKADESATLASIRRNEDAKGGELICSGNKTVGRFEKEMLEVFGIKVQVATPDDWTLVLDGITLSKLKNIPEKTSKADMESLVAYKRGSKEDESAEVEEIGGEYLSVDADSTETQSMNEVELSINPTSAFRMSLFPIIGEEANQMIDDNGFDIDLFYDLEQLYIDDTERKYDIVVDFYSSSDGAEYFIDGGDAEEMEDNALVIDNGIANEEDGEEEDGDGFSDDFILVEKLKMEGSHSSISKDIFQDILDRHNEGLDDDHVDIIINAVQRQMKQVAEQLVSDGLVDDVDYVRFALQYGPMYGASYSCNIRTDEFYPEKLRVLNCEDWNDCNISSTLQEHWPDRLLNNIVYDDKFYELECTGVDDFEFDVDLVNCYFESL